MSQKIWCCGCNCEVSAKLTSGREVYPHRKDLSLLPFWKCNSCGNWVGCHHKTKDRTRPLGVIPTPEIKKARSHIHSLIDPLWKSGTVKRGKLYSMISDSIGYSYHTAEIKTVEDAREIYRACLEIRRGLNPE